MHLAFVDIVYDYAADRPDQDEPVGGTTSAICFIARELVKAGVRCTFFNKVTTRQRVMDIDVFPIDALIDERFNPQYTAFIFCGRWVDWMVKSIREATKAPLIAWMHESLMVAPLTAPLPELDGIVFISEWQKRTNRSYVPAHYKQAIIQNGMNPRFASLFKPGESILDAKTKPPILFYVGVTPRGAFHLPPLLDELRKIRTDFTMEIFCNCAPTRDPAANEKYMTWMRSLPNITHVGQMGQRAYAEHVKRASIMVAPNPWPETFCISLVESMAAGLGVVMSNRAVLPEIANGFAQHIIPVEDADHPLRFDMPMPYEAFAKAIDETMTRWLTKPDEVERHLRKQVDYFVGRFQWPHYVAPWIDYLRSFG